MGNYTFYIKTLTTKQCFFVKKNKKKNEIRLLQQQQQNIKNKLNKRERSEKKTNSHCPMSTQVFK